MIKAAAGSTDITPGEPLPRRGFSKRYKPFEGVDDPLEANALLLDDGRTRAAVVSADLLYIGNGLRKRILDALESPLGSESLMLAASHTHYAPMALSGMPELGSVDEHYVDTVAKRIASLLDSLAARTKPVTLYYGEGDAEHSINRRLRRLRIWRNGVTWTVGMGPNRLGPRDETVRLLRLVDQCGGCVCVAWNYACHPTGYPRSTHISAEYPGKVRSRLRGHLGENTPILFFQGFSGDIRPPFEAKVRGLNSLARRVCLGPIFGIPSTKHWGHWAASLAERVLEIYSNSSQALSQGELRAIRIPISLDDCISGGRRDRALGLQSIAVGRDFRWVGLEAEVVVAYRRLVEGLFPGCRVFTVGCIDHVLGYLPTGTMVSEGGYEVEEFRARFAFDGYYTAGIEAKVESTMRRLIDAEELGAQP